MLLDFIDKKIRKSFSNAAVQYDVLASLHREIGRELTKKVAEFNPQGWVLDVGMGTGWLSKRLANHFEGAKVVGIDFAPGMIDQAKKLESDFKIVEANAKALPFKEETFHILTSNLAFQWVGDLLPAFTLSQRVLKNDGALCATMFGQKTFQELFASFEAAHASNNSLLIERLPNRDDVISALAASGFSEISVEVEEIKVRYPNSLELIKWIKQVGANALKTNFFLGKDLLNKVCTHYDAQYSDDFGIFATFEVLWMTAKKKSQ